MVYYHHYRCLSSSSSEPLMLPWPMPDNWAMMEECGPRESSDLPHRLLDTLGEVDTEMEKCFSLLLLLYTELEP